MNDWLTKQRHAQQRAKRLKMTVPTTPRPCSAPAVERGPRSSLCERAPTVASAGFGRSQGYDPH
jgi:hypothetical protein